MQRKSTDPNLNEIHIEISELKLKPLLKEENEDHFVASDITSLLIKGTINIIHIIVVKVDRDGFSEVGVQMSAKWLVVSYKQYFHHCWFADSL